MWRAFGKSRHPRQQPPILQRGGKHNPPSSTLPADFKAIYGSSQVSKKALDARTKQHEDLLKRKPIDLRNELENYAHWLKNRPASETAQMSTSAKALLEENIRATLDWLKANAKADVREIEAKKTNLETVELAAGKAYEQSETTSSTRIQRLD